MVKVSVIVPIYNAERVLSKCIKSIIDQSFRDIEIVLINDGSTDNSLEICNKFKKQDKRIIVINKKNEGSVKTRRKGVEVSKSQYIMFVDADDWIDTKAIEILYNEIINSDSDITVCNMYKVLSSKGLIKKKNNSIYFKRDRIYQNEEIKNELVVAYLYGHPFPPSLSGKLYKKNLLLSSGKYLDKIHFFGEDLFYNLEIFLKINRVKLIEKSLYFYRVGGFTSKYMSHMFEDSVNGYEIQKEVIEEYYSDTKEDQYKGISIMLLNTFKTCLYNCISSDLNEMEIKQMIGAYIQHKNILEVLDNDGVKKYFEEQYLLAIRNKDTDYLYELGSNIYNQRKYKRLLFNIISCFR